MKVFISWSGAKSGEVAQALRDWLPYVINDVEPFVSSKDIEPGARWPTEIARRLEDTAYGIVCVTRDNQHVQWLNFEAGALAKAVDESRVVPLAIDLKPSDIEPPLGHFQAQEATTNGIRAVVRAINAACERSLEEGRLDTAFDRWWPDLDAKLKAVEESVPTPSGDTRSDRELLEETLDLARSLVRQGDYERRQPSSIEIDFSKLGPQPKEFGLGQRVSHPDFGDGVVVGTEPGGIIVVRYGSGRERRLSAQHAPLTAL